MTHLEFYDGVSWCTDYDRTDLDGRACRDGGHTFWCSTSGPPRGKALDEILAKVDCRECLASVASFARAADLRAWALRQNRDECSYPSHSDDCDCRGAGGDR